MDEMLYPSKPRVKKPASDEPDLFDTPKPKPAPRYTWYSVPAGTLPSECRTCKATIYWADNPASGRRLPVDCEVDGAHEPSHPRARDKHDGRGVSHFQTCPDANEHSARGRR